MQPPPRYSPLHSYTTFTVRCTPACGSWLSHQAEDSGKSVTELVGGFLDDLRLWFGLGEAVGAVLRERAAKLRLSQRDYLIDLLEKRYEAVRKNGVGWQKGSLEVLQAKRSSAGWGMALEGKP